MGKQKILFINIKPSIILFFLFLFFTFPKPAHAALTTENFATTTRCSDDWKDQNNFLGAPDSLYATITNKFPFCLFNGFSPFNIPADSAINKIIVRIYNSNSGNTGSPSMSPTYNETQSCVPPPFWPGALYNNIHEYIVTPANCVTKFPTLAQLNSPLIGWQFYNSYLPNTTAEMDAISMQVDYTASISTPPPTPTPSSIAQQLGHGAYLSGNISTGNYTIQSLGTNLKGYLKSIDLWVRLFTSSATLKVRVLCFNESSYSTTCANSNYSDPVSITAPLSGDNYNFPNINYLLNNAKYYKINVDVTTSGSNNAITIFGTGTDHYTPGGCLFSNTGMCPAENIADYYFILNPGDVPTPTPSPSPTPSASPTPAPFLDLPFDYQSQGNSFEQVALDPESWFDHEYPLADILCTNSYCPLDIVRYDSFGKRVTDAYKHHNGYDYSEYRNGAVRNTPVLAAASGSAKIILEGNSHGYGNLVKIDHPNGYQTWYAHLSDTGLLQLDQNGKKLVQKGEKIGEVGNTGNSTGYHIHFTVLKDANENGTYDDDDDYGKPYGFVDPLGWKEEDENRIKYTDPWTQWTKDGRNGSVSYSLFSEKKPPVEQQIIKNEGGEINTDKIKINVPQNALPVNAAINIEKTAFDSAIIDGDILKSIVPSIILTARSITGELIKFFSVPIQITYNYSEANLTNILTESIQLFFYDEKLKKWEPVQTIIKDPATQIITSGAFHFSRFALMGKLKDTLPPVTKAILDNNPEIKEWYNSVPVTLTLLPEDNHENSLGLADTFYSTDYTENDNNWKDYLNSVKFYNDGNYSIRYFSTDNAGNKEEQKTVSFGIDQTAPVSTANINGKNGENGWYTTDVQVDLSADDQNGSGVENIEYALNNSTFAAYTTPFTISDEGGHNLKFRATDKAGNIEELKTITIKIDKTPPQTTLYMSWSKGGSEWYGSDVVVSFDAKDNIPGLPAIFYKLDDENNFTRYLDNTIKITKEGSTTITYYSVDDAGNVENPKLKEIKIDKTPPVVSLTASPDTVWPPNGKMVDVKITGNSTDSHLKNTTFKVEDEYGLIEPSLTTFGQTIKLEAKRNGDDLDGRKYTIEVTSEDLAENITKEYATVTVPHDQRK